MDEARGKEDYLFLHDILRDKILINSPDCGRIFND